MDETPTSFDLKVLLATRVDMAVAAFIRRLMTHPDEITADDLRQAVRRWFSGSEISDAWLRLIETYQESEFYKYQEAVYLLGPLNPAWRNSFVRTLILEYQRKLDMSDPISQLGAMLGKGHGKSRKPQKFAEL